jgi:hypothetical protein
MIWNHLMSIEDAGAGDNVGGATEQTEATEQAGTEAQVAATEAEGQEPEITETSEPAVVLSSYQRLKLKSDEAASTYTAKIAELEAKLAEGEGFVGIKIDKPSDEWGVDGAKQALESLPESHRDLVVTAVIDTALAPLAQTVAADPESYPEDYAALNKAMTPIMEVAYQRPLQEVNAIMTLTQGISSDQLRAILGGQSVQIGGFQPTFQGNTNNALYAAAQQAGLNMEDEGVKGFLAQTNGMLAQSQSRVSGLESRLTNFEKELERVRSGQSTQTEAQARQAIETQIEQARTGAFEIATKDPTGNSRIPAGDTKSARLIKALAEDELKASTLETHKANATKWHKDGLKDAALRSLKLAQGVINTAYAKAAAEVLGTTPAKPGEKAPTRLAGGAAAAATGSPQEILSKLGPIGSNMDNARKQAEALYQANQGT